jgi:hypothetical protein
MDRIAVAAIELLTGHPELTVATETKRFNAKQLAENLLLTAMSVRVEPGTLALCFGHFTQDWAKAQAAMKQIYTNQQAVWSEVNQIANRDRRSVQAHAGRIDTDNDRPIAFESKQDMRKRGMPSPDEADAVALCFADPSGFAHNADFHRSLVDRYQGAYV